MLNVLRPDMMTGRIPSPIISSAIAANPTNALVGSCVIGVAIDVICKKDWVRNMICVAKRAQGIAMMMVNVT